jgi:hypothetical protein
VTYLSNQFTLLYNSQSQFPVLGVWLRAISLLSFTR